jgi:hypothetical protein
LEARGYDVTAIHTANYRTLTNEVTLRDVAEGFDRALRARAGLDNDEPFDALVHSTGMLVVRAWLAAYGHRRGRLKHLIGLAPASFGSPLAHKGRSWLGALFKGNRTFGPDFLEAGDQILDALELGSRFTWDLAHRDLIARQPGDPPFYGPNGDTPYVFIFCGTRGYAGIRGLVNEPGTDGTVRLAGCPLNTRKLMVDLTKDPALDQRAARFRVEPWSNVDIPLVPVPGRNHGTIVSDPGPDLIRMVAEALEVSTREGLLAWNAAHTRGAAAALDEVGRWQQFIVRAVDERGDPITDYNVQLHSGRRGPLEDPLLFDTDVHTYSGDPSLRCFHVDLRQLDDDRLKSLWVRLTVSSGTQLVGYEGFSDDPGTPEEAAEAAKAGTWEGWLDLSGLLRRDVGGDTVRFFYPFTTTLAEVRLNREPLPRGLKRASDLFTLE